MTVTERKYAEYYKRFKDLLKNGCSWSDQESLRLEYLDILKHYGADTLRRGSLLYKEFLEHGVIKDNDILNTKYDANGESKKDSSEANVENYPESIEYKSDGVTISKKIIKTNPLELQNKESILLAHGYDPEKFELISSKHSIWNSGKDKDGSKKVLYSSKITVKPIIDLKNEISFKNVLDELAKNYKKPDMDNSNNTNNLINNKEQVNDKKNCVVLSLNDLHWGRYISPELNKKEEAYNSEKEADRILDVMRQVVKRYKKLNIDKFVLVLGSDFFNSDCYGFTTKHRNKQDNGMNFKDIFSTGLTLCCSLIDMATFITNNVHVYFVPGNHGNNEDYMLGKCVQGWYNTSHNVTVHVSSSARQYMRYGNNLIGFTHGDKEKKNLSGLMSVEASDAWGLTDHHTWITGHLHQIKETIIEENGVTIYTCPSLALNDEYTYNKGYSSKKRIMGFVFDEEEGLVETNYFYSK